MRLIPADLLKVSRPGLWLVFIWLYVWPTGGDFNLLITSKFWIGFLYCTFPLNLLVYGMNDMVDDDVDAGNQRKGNYVYGAKLDRSSLKKLPAYIAAVNIFALLPILCIDLSLLVYICSWLLVAVVVNYAYNCPPLQLSRKCPYEVPTMIIGHLLIPHFACRINGIHEWPSLGSIVFHIFLLSRSHIWLEYADIDVDEVAGKRTIAVVLGHRRALLLVLLLTAMEAVSGFLLLHSNVLGVFSLFGMLVFYHSSGKSSSKTDKSFVSVSQSLVGVVLMVYLWHQRVFR